MQLNMPTAGSAPAGRRTLLGRWSWALFDGARIPDNVLVNIFVFSAYFSTVVISDPVRGQIVWSYTSAVGAILVAIGAPILGAIADAGGRRKPWLVGCIAVGIPCMAALWFATPAMASGLIWVMVAIVGAMLFYEYSAIFCNAMLPNIAPQGIGFWSGMGFALGNAFGVVLFLFFLFAWSWNPHPLFGLDKALHEPERAVGILASVWMLIFGLPLFLFTPDTAGTRLGMGTTIRRGLKSLIETLTRVRQFRNVGVFLIARMTYNEGFVVLMSFSGIYAAGVLHWSAEALIVQGLLNSVAAALAGALAGWMDLKIGSRRSAMIFVAGSLLAIVIVCSTSPDTALFVKLSPPLQNFGGMFPTLPDIVFCIAQVLAATFVTGGLSSSRALMGKLAPPAMLNEFFGVYAMSGTATSFVGPLAIGLVTTLSHSQRIGIASGIAFLVVGMLLLLRVKEPEVAAHI
jgi:MFS transporter, UMF1 family